MLSFLGDYAFDSIGCLDLDTETTSAPAMEGSNLEKPAALSNDELRYKARYIRDIIAPVIDSAPDEALAPYRLANLRDIFIALEYTPTTGYAIEYSRIGKALFEICSKGTKWPNEFVVRAEKQLRKWIAEFGDITGLIPLLWVPGGRMYGIEKIQEQQRPRSLGKAERILGYSGRPRWRWSVDMRYTKDPRRFGHHGFEVGDWWIDPICAIRDGIIGNVGRVTVGEQGVYAMVLTENDAIDTENGKFLFEWNPDQHKEDPSAPDVRELLKNVISREPIRVLRTSRMQSRIAPIAGVRYDGLYSVSRHGLKRDHEQLRLFVELARDPDQVDISEALKRPRAEERDDWEFYNRVEGGVVVSDAIPI